MQNPKPCFHPISLVILGEEIRMLIHRKILYYLITAYINWVLKKYGHKKTPSINRRGFKKNGDDILSRLLSTICAIELNFSVRNGKR